MRILLASIVLVVTSLMLSASAVAQVYGIELHNSVMPASGAMGGASLSRPQDLQSAINGNPATTTQFDGTTFAFGGAFVEPTYNISQATPLPLLGVSTYSGKSDTPAVLVPNIGVLRQSELMGMPITAGLGFMTNAGLGVDFRPISASNGTISSYQALDLITSLGAEVYDGLSLGTSFTLGTSILDGPFVASSSSASDYSPRFTIGANYELGGGTSVGAFWQSKKSFTFENVARFNSGPLAGQFQDLDLDHPSNFGLGVANRCLLDGRLLLAADVLFKQYSEADFWQSIYGDQWVLQLGGQYLVGQHLKLRMGYAYNEDPTLGMVPGTIGGVIPVGGIPAVQYIEGQFASISEHRLTGGFGLQEVVPNVDFDLTAGGMFENTKSFGNTTASVKGYWLAFGFTYHCPRPGQVCNN
jgi:long-chain fatty acid transport protein